jgi:hypothetical protein
LEALICEAGKLAKLKECLAPARDLPDRKLQQDAISAVFALAVSFKGQVAFPQTKLGIKQLGRAGNVQRGLECVSVVFQLESRLKDQHE